MARYTGPKHKLARREAINILGKQSSSLERRLNVPPGLHGRRNRRKTSEYGMQLREKQKLKAIYGLLEKQFRRYVDKAQKKKENTIEVLIQELETRLDNVVYRLGYAKSRYMARQFVTHRHVSINGAKVNIPSYSVSENETIAISPKIVEKNPAVKQMIDEQQEGDLPAYLERKGPVGRLIRKPMVDDIQNPVDYQLVIEFYSR